VRYCSSTLSVFLATFIALFVADTSARAVPPTCAELRAEKSKTYGFHLAQLNEAQLDAKSKELDVFWKHVQAAGPEGVTCIRALLAEEKTDHIFQVDAAGMLFPADPSLETRNLIRDSLAQADFQESDPANYLTLAFALGRAGVDIRPLAAKLLLYPNSVIHISEHDLDLDSDTSALFLYGSMEPSQASNALTALLDAHELFVRAAAAHLLAEQMTDESFRTLNNWDGFSKIEEDFRRNDIRAILKYQPQNPADYANPKFTREQILQTMASLPHTQKEFDEVMSTKGAAFDQQMRDKKVTQQQLAQAVADSLPIYGVADHTAFITSAVATLEPGDFPTIREARRKSLYNVSDESLAEYLAYTQIMIGMLNHLDLYKDYRQH
jgi:3-methyladenine DNA glycosylase AlkC